MAGLEDALEEDRKAVGEFVAEARAVPLDRWMTPRGPGKWSAAQVCEHVARAYERSSEMLRGTPQPGMPRWLRPVIRLLYLNKVLKTGSFPKGAKSPEQFLPSANAAPLDQSLGRIEKASAEFGAEARKRGGEGSTIDHPVFGRIRVAYRLTVTLRGGHNCLRGKMLARAGCGSRSAGRAPPERGPYQRSRTGPRLNVSRKGTAATWTSSS